MLYTNKALAIENREMSWGSLKGFAIGERGRGRYEVFVPVPEKLENTSISKGLHEKFTIGTTKNGKPRLNTYDDGNLFLILSSECRYTRRGSGHIYEVTKELAEVIATANGADGDAGRIGSWDAKILKVKPGAILRVIWGGYNYGIDDTYYFVTSNGTVDEVNEKEIQDYFDSKDIDMPEYFQKMFNKESA
jgi:hypothetical protein